ncbi:ATP-dependent DNA helicase Q4 [Mactra antiquata]
MNALLIVAVCTLFSSTIAVDMSAVQPYDLTATLMFLQEDTDSDGYLTVAEIDAVFAKYDQNGDGRVSRREYTTMLCDANPALYQISHYLFDAYDVNHDHHLEVEDYEGFHAKMEVDGDGLVSQQEFVTYWVALFEDIETQEAQHVHGNSHEHGHCPAAGKR